MTRATTKRTTRAAKKVQAGREGPRSGSPPRCAHIRQDRARRREPHRRQARDQARYLPRVACPARGSSHRRCTAGDRLAGAQRAGGAHRPAQTGLRAVALEERGRDHPLPGGGCCCRCRVSKPAAPAGCRRPPPGPRRADLDPHRPMTSPRPLRPSLTST